MHRYAVRVWSGELVDPFDMTADDIHISDIAHSLARQCRYNGHVEGFLSVAAHSIWVSMRLQELGESEQMQLWGLLHDAAEAYLGDLVHPIKKRPEMAFYIEAELRLESLIADRYGLPFPMPSVVKEADVYVATVLEKPDLRQTWQTSPSDDESAFLTVFESLTRS